MSPSIYSVTWSEYFERCWYVLQALLQSISVAVWSIREKKRQSARKCQLNEVRSKVRLSSQIIRNRISFDKIEKKIVLITVLYGKFTSSILVLEPPSSIWIPLFFLPSDICFFFNFGIFLTMASVNTHNNIYTNTK